MKATIKDVAREAGVSVSTVSYALSRKGPAVKETHKRVLAAVEKLGYVPDATARSLVMSRTNNFAVIIGRIPAIEQDPYHIGLIDAFSRALAEAGCWMSLYLEDGSSPERLAALLADAKVDGIAMMRMSEIPDAVRTVIDRRALPLVSCETPAPPASCSLNLTVNPEPGIREAISHLVSLGHRRIGLFHFHPESRRLQAAADSLRERGLTPLIRPGEGPGREQAYTDMLRWIDSGEPLPSAILTGTDLAAISVLDALKSRGLQVPADISVIGYDDIYEARHLNPPLTTISQDISGTVQTIVRTLLALRDGEVPEEKEQIVNTALVIRRSTGKAPE